MITRGATVRGDIGPTDKICFERAKRSRGQCQRGAPDRTRSAPRSRTTAASAVLLVERWLGCSVNKQIRHRRRSYSLAARCRETS
jgi:hypothetical protein